MKCCQGFTLTEVDELLYRTFGRESDVRLTLGLVAAPSMRHALSLTLIIACRSAIVPQALEIYDSFIQLSDSLRLSRNITDRLLHEEYSRIDGGLLRCSNLNVVLAPPDLILVGNWEEQNNGFDRLRDHRE